MRKLKLCALLIVMFGMSSAVFGYEQQKYAGSATSPQNHWDIPDNATGLENDLCSTATSANRQIDLTNFGFNLPPGVIIGGIVVDIKCGHTAGGSLPVQLLKAGNPVGSAKSVTPLTASQCSDTSWKSAGSMTDLWGTTWGPDDINSSNFGVRIESGTGGGTRRIDAVRITVYCTLPRHTLTVDVTPQGGGTVDVSPAPGADGKYEYCTIVTLTPQPAEHYEFKEWSGANGGDVYQENGAWKIHIDGDKSITAVFQWKRYTLTIDVDPANGGMVNVNPIPGPDGKYEHCTLVTLTPQPAAGYEFVRWEGTNAGDVYQENGAWKIHINGDKSITAVFSAVGPQPLFFEDFDDVTGWTKSGLWHVCTDQCFAGCNKLIGAYAHYAKPGTCSYDTGARTMGILTSPEIRIPKNATLTLQFDFARHVESDARVFRDQTSVQVRFGFVCIVGGQERVIWSMWIPIWARSCRNPSPDCGTFTYNFRTCSYERMQIRFVFDSVDRWANNFPGWAIDNVVVKPPTMAPGALEVADIGPGWDGSMQTETLGVVNTPNPVRDVHTTTFTVLGVDAEAVRVEVYDLTGRLVWKAEAPGNELVWHTEDLTGLPLANGVYLYVTYVKVGGSWIKLEPQKLVILR